MWHWFFKFLLMAVVCGFFGTLIINGHASRADLKILSGVLLVVSLWGVWKLPR